MLSRRFMMRSLGESGLSVIQAGQADWHRPHSVQVEKSSICFQVKWPISPTPKTVSSSTFSMSMSGVEYKGAEGPGAAGEGHVDGRQEDVQVLGVGDEDDEARDDGDVEDEEDGDQHRVDARPERVQQLGDGMGGEGAPAVGELGRVGVDLGAAVEEQGDHDAGDHEEDEPGRTGVAAVEAGLALETFGGVLQADDGEGDEGEEDGAGEEVLDEADPVPGPDARDVEVLVEEVAVGLDDREEQDGEAPHGEEVGQAGHRPLQELALTGHLGDLGLGLAAEGSPGPGGVLLPRTDELRQPVKPPGRDAKADHGDAEAENDPDRHECSSP